MNHSMERERNLKVLVIKTSSLGDVIHTLPALTDAAKACPGISFDWVVEEGFAEIPHGTRMLTALSLSLFAAGARTF